MIIEILSTPAAQWSLIAILTMAVLMAIVLLRQSKLYSKEIESLKAESNQNVTELTLCQQRMQQMTSSEEKGREQLRQLQDQLVQQQTVLSERSSRLAVLENVSQDMESLKATLITKESELRQLYADHQSLQAKSLAEKNSLEEKLSLLKDAREQLNSEFSLLANKIFDDKQQRFNEQSQKTLTDSVNPLKEQIEAFRKKVEDAYDKENSERSKLVGQITELQKQTRQIGEDAINLTNALKGDNKAQGNWGEVILERLLEESGLQKGREYDVQVGLKDEDGRRRNPDVIIRLPEGKDIVIDSKVSLIHYEQSVSNPDEVQRQQALKQHVASLRSHVQQLSAKSYEKLEGIRSLDFVFLFVPVEAAFMAALQADSSLFQEAYSKHIIIVSPTTLLATLRTVENIWRYEKQNSNAEEIARQAGGLHDQFVLLFEAFEDIGKQIDKAGESYKVARKRLVSGRGNLMRRVESLRLLGAKTKKQLPVDKLGDADTEELLLETEGRAETEPDELDTE